MTEIKIKRLSLENFKCHESLTLDLMGGNASVYGDNATGKTSIYDALTWLLFGKDSLGNGEKNIEIKPLDASGEVRDHLAVTAVEAVLLVNGEEISLRRTYKEIWSTRRGSSEPVYDGNTSEYYVDGVPCKKNAFQNRVGELVSEETFRMLTSVSYFAKDIPWQERRAVLFDVAGVQDDTQILATDARFEPLVEGMGKLTLDGYKKKLLSEKKGFVGTKTEVPARISECQKTIDDTRNLDFAGARVELDALNRQKEQLTQQIIAIEHNGAADQKRLEIREVQLQIDTLNSENNAFRKSQTVGSLCAADIRRDISRMQSTVAHKKTLLEAAEKSLSNCDRLIADLRNKWVQINGEVFTGGNCPTCGQALPADKLQRSMEAFERNKANRLREVEQSANAQIEVKAQTEDRCTELREGIASLEAQIQERNADLENMEAIQPEIKDMDDYAERMKVLRDTHTALSQELADMMLNSAGAKEKLRQQIEEINEQLKVHMAVIGKESVLEYAQKRIESLREDATNTAAALDAIDKMLFLMDEYSRYKTRFVEESINNLFRIARFRLFREQANGGVEDRCDVVLDGVPYINVNNGARINVGIDIINTLSSAYGVRVPLFVDNAEGVTRLEESQAQIIRLVVSEKDKELRVQYENQR